jgi:eukaryotic-like serine/threonine-protein kinase
MDRADPQEIEQFVRLGSVLAGKYRIQRVLGVGGMGVVVAAQHLQLGETVAIKFLLPRVLGTRKSAQRFLREARASSRLKSSSVARVFDTDVRDDGAAFIVMEYLDGEPLSAQLQRERKLSVTSAVDVVLEACTALAEAHARGIVHRDLKPANLFIARTAGNLKLVKVLDFGISKLLESDAESDHTTGDSVMGSPPYMSPEQLSQPSSVDHRSDIWSVGVVLYEVSTGKSPFAAGSFAETCARILQHDPPGIAELDPSLPAALGAVVARCLQKDRALRFPSILALAQQLEPFGSERSTSSLRAINAIAAGESGRTDFERASTSPAEPPPATPDGDFLPTATSAPVDTGTLTAAAHSGRPTRPSTQRLAAALLVCAAVLAAWLGSRLMSARHLPRGDASSTAAASGPSLAPQSPATKPTPEPATTTTASSSTAPAAVVSPRMKDKRVVAGLTPASASIKAPAASAGPVPARGVDSVFGERH